MSDTDFPPVAQAVPAETADAAADDLKVCIEPDRLNHEKFPWLYLPPGRPSTQRVVESWFQVWVVTKYRDGMANIL